MRRPGRRSGSGRSGARRGGREGIIRAALHVFGQVGFEAATVRGIASEAGVSAAAVYHYFDGKQGLVLAACEPEASALKARLESLGRAPSGPTSHTLAILETAMAWALQNLDVYELLLAGTAAPRSGKIWALGRELEAACLRELEAALSGVSGWSPDDRSRIEAGAQALWAAANGVICLCLRLGCPTSVGPLLSAAVEPILAEMIAAELDRAGAATPHRGSAAR
ncbi:MAG: helix-turn-helix domain-containing protein [Phenylobacterium sp.]|uniref:TetR/AcrR family transcriptional regulator n=1 Tax=Phenylobacterium sp. TaxID=1871053 RepID=UPI002734469A|nr:TetR/AcrR family transcriptional regulator [Phenylobacterium sp.]MDP3749127.1 helix-turn-helix domain-containing protein [Phenylobacterium sp.]